MKDLNSGTFGFVQLCRDKTTNELVAIKFIERGDKVRAGWWMGASVRTHAHARARTSHFLSPSPPMPRPAQVTKYVEREIVNHRTLMHPHIVQFKEVSGRWKEEAGANFSPVRRPSPTRPLHASCVMY